MNNRHDELDDEFVLSSPAFDGLELEEAPADGELPQRLLEARTWDDIIRPQLNEELGALLDTTCMQSRGGKEFLQEINTLAEGMPGLISPETASLRMHKLTMIRIELEKFLTVLLHGPQTIAKISERKDGLRHDLLRLMKTVTGNTEPKERISIEAGHEIKPGEQPWRSSDGGTMDSQESLRLTQKINEAIGCLQKEINSLEHYLKQVLPSNKRTATSSEELEFLNEPEADGGLVIDGSLSED